MNNIENDALGKKPKKINSKQKGNRAELSAAKVLSKWVGVKFARTPGSGALRWVNNASICGDLTCEDQDFNFPFTIEVKHYKDFQIQKNLRENSKIYTFWNQALEDSKRGSKLPMLMVRKNGMPKDEFIVFFDIAQATSIKDMGFTEVVSKGSPILSSIFIVGYNSKDLFKSIKFSNFVAKI